MQRGALRFARVFMIAAVAVGTSFAGSAFAQTDGDEWLEDGADSEEFAPEEYEDFGAEDFEEFPAEEYEDFEDFGEETTDGDFEEFGLPTVTGLILPNDVLAGPLADQLTRVLNEKLGDLVEYSSRGNDGILEEFDIMGPELAGECAFDPVCMGRVGQQIGVDYIVVGRVERSEDGDWTTTLDLMNTGLSSIDNFVFFKTDGRTAAVQEEIPDQILRLFRIRNDLVSGRDEATRGGVQKALAWTTLALGVGAIGAGTYFGLDYGSQRRDIEDWPVLVDDNGEPLRDRGNRLIYDRSMVETQTAIDDADKSKSLSLILGGVGAGLLVTSVVLFVVTPGEDIYEEADGEASNRRRRSFALAPVIGPDLAGVTTHLNF